MDKNKVFESLTDLELLTLCMYGEARGEGLDGMLAVGSVAMNRAKTPSWWGSNLRQVILKPAQFSCFNEDNPLTLGNERDPNREMLQRIALDFNWYLKSFETFKAAYWLSKRILEGMITSNVGNVTHYHAANISPDWAKRKELTFIRQINKHLFYV